MTLPNTLVTFFYFTVGLHADKTEQAGYRIFESIVEKGFFAHDKQRAA